MKLERRRILCCAFILVYTLAVYITPSLRAQQNGFISQFPDTNMVAYIQWLDEAVRSKHVGNIGIFANLVNQREDQKVQLGRQLLQVFNNPKSSVAARGCAATYLGVIHAQDAVNDLAAGIDFRFSFEGLGTHGISDEPDIRNYPAQAALVNIGTPSIPAVIRNIEEKDDANVRKLSVEVLRQIDGDKDIVQLRLKKALAAEKEDAKKARLETAIKSLADIPVGK